MSQSIAAQKLHDSRSNDNSQVYTSSVLMKTFVILRKFRDKMNTSIPVTIYRAARELVNVFA